MQLLADELAAEGKEISVIIVNKIGAESTQSSLTATCTFPLMQDVTDINAWALHEGGKDDLYVYDATGTLTAFLPFSGELSINLGSSVGYENVKNAVLAAF